MDILFHNVPAVFDDDRALAQKLNISLAGRRADVSGNGKYVSPLLQRPICRNERARALRRFYNDHAERKRADNPVSDREMRAERGCLRRVFTK